MLRYLLVFAACFAACFASERSGGADELTTGIQNGVERVLAERQEISPLVRLELAELIVPRLALEVENYITDVKRIGDIRYEMAQDYLKMAILSATSRTRWPTEQIIQHMEKMNAETQLKLQSRLRRNGLNSRMSALDVEHIIEEVIASLMKDPTFLELLEWLRTLPTSLHNIADALFANKTFAEIFAALQTQSLQEQVDAILANDVQKQEGTLTGSEVTISLAEAGLIETRAILERIVEVLRQGSVNQTQRLNELADELLEKSPFIPQDVLDYIRAAAIKMLN